MHEQLTSSGETRQLRRASFAQTLDALAARGYRPHRTGSGWHRARCPGHGDSRSNPESLAFGEREDGAPRLKCHAHNCDRRDILEPLGLWFDPEATHPRPAHRAPAPKPEPSATAITAAAIIDKAITADGTPALAYLAGRLAWPRTGLPLPASVRWLPADAVPKGVHLPATAAGAVVYLFATDAVQVEALEDDGRHATTRQGRWRCGYGTRKGRVFEASGGTSLTVLAEGPVTALAATFRYPGARCVAMGGDDFTSFTPDGSAIVIERDGDPAGLKAALAALDAFPEAELVNRETGDVADELAGDLGERAAIAEFDGGAERQEAEAIAWREFGVAP